MRYSHAPMPSERPYRPQPPFEGWPAQWVLPFGMAWLTPHGNALLTQSTARVGSVDVVHGLHDFLDDLLLQGVRRRMPGLVVVHDWRSVQSIGPGAREAWNDRTRREDTSYRDLDVYVATSAKPLLRMALRSAALTIQLAIGQRMANFVDNLDEPLARHGIQPPPHDFWQRWLSGKW